jgi:hypothetical protein
VILLEKEINNTNPATLKEAINNFSLRKNKKPYKNIKKSLKV